MFQEGAFESLPAPTRRGLVLSWFCQLLTAGILAQTLFFKFTYAPETQEIFRRLGGRPAATLVGLAELACVLLLLFPRTAALGALLALGVIAGAIGTHMFAIGVRVVDRATGGDDGGLLFALAVTVAALSSVVLLLRREELRGWLRWIR